MQIGDMVYIDGLIGIVTFVDSESVIAKCHDGLAHESKLNDAQLITKSEDMVTQYEEAIRSYGQDNGRQKH